MSESDAAYRRIVDEFCTCDGTRGWSCTLGGMMRCKETIAAWEKWLKKRGRR